MNTTSSPIRIDDLRLADYLPLSRLRVASTKINTPSSRCVDAHNHLGRSNTPGGWEQSDTGSLVDLMDQAGVRAIINLDGGWSDALVESLNRYDRAYAGRFATFCEVDWSSLRFGGTVAALVQSLHQSAAVGARGLKVRKSLGLSLEDANGKLLNPSDERLDPIWAAAGELGLPIVIHTVDPMAFFESVDRRNERYEELHAHPEWSFSDERFPRFWDLVTSLATIVGRHPSTIFVGAHVGCCAEDLGWVAEMLERHDNFHLDISARINELGRQPRAASEFIIKYSDRVLFGTDHYPPDVSTYFHYYRFLESSDEYFPYHTNEAEAPPQGRWRVSGLDLPANVLSLVYSENARRTLDV